MLDSFFFGSPIPHPTTTLVRFAPIPHTIAGLLAFFNKKSAKWE